MTTSASGWAEAIERRGCGIVCGTGPRRWLRRAGAPQQHQFDEVGPERERQVLIGVYEQILGARAGLAARP